MNAYDEAELQQTLKNVVDAIHHVLRVEVTVVDRHYRRLAGTGLYADQVGDLVGSNSAFAKAMKTRRSFIIDAPGANPICLDCAKKGQCCETAEVCCPIVLEGVSVGAIGLIAFDEAQKESLLGQRESLMPFLENMANLISAKMKEISQAKELALLTDAVDNPLMSIDEKGCILRKNAAAEALLRANRAADLTDAFGKAVLESILAGDQQLQVKSRKQGQVFDLKAQAIEAGSQYVLLLKPVREVIGYVNRYINQGAGTEFKDIWGEHPKLLQAKAFAKQAAASSASVLILGESGTGKELFARAIHNASPRADQVFLAINCAAIPETLLESELFGYEEGAFTGALRSGKIGRFEQAHKGTLFLDEIGDMPLHLQAKLLRVLQEGRIQKIGGQREVPVDVRIVAATNQNLEQLVLEGAFRKDLYYRINVIPLEICPLRERISDLPLLCERFLLRSAHRLGRAAAGLSDDALKRLMRYQWPGNIRELENVIEYMVNMSEGSLLVATDLPPRFQAKEVGQKIETGTSGEASGGEAHREMALMTFQEMEQQLIREALRRYGRSKTGIYQCCSVLGVSRATLYRKLKELSPEYAI